MMKTLNNLSTPDGYWMISSVMAGLLLMSLTVSAEETAQTMDIQVGNRFKANMESIQLFSPPIEMSVDALRAAISADLQNASSNLLISYTAPPLLSGSEQYYDAVLVTDSRVEARSNGIHLQQ